MGDLVKAKAKKQRVLVSAHVVADVGTPKHYRWSVEEFAKALEYDCKFFIEHCRDHRSIDHIKLDVERVYEDQCSACDSELEIVRDPELNEGRPSCAGCGAELEGI